MKNLLNRIGIVILILTCILVLTNCKESDKPALRIATAANMQYAVDSLITVFEASTSIDCEAIISSSGNLTAQIMQGAPFDIFIAADMKYPMGLYTSGHTSKPPKIYARGQLMLWTMSKSVELSLDKLMMDNIKHIAIANPKIAPYGAASMEVLNQLKDSEKLKKKLVYGESIAQTNQFVVTMAADIGLTTPAVLKAPLLGYKGRWKIVSDSLYSPINQGVVILENRGDYKKEAVLFYEFLFSEKGRNILNEYGYLEPFKK